MSLAKLFTMICRISPRLRRALWKQWYEFIARFYPRSDWTFMNYGYAPVDADSEQLLLDETDEENRSCIQLYHHLASAVDLTGLDVLEIGSGRGGGADFVRRYHKPRSVVGVDISQNAVSFCTEHYAGDGLSFETGGAESLPFPDGSFDVAVNVESSHCYGSLAGFLAEVERVLREGGHFLYADFRPKETIDVVRRELHTSGLTIIKETDITPNVVEALALDSVRKADRIKAHVHRFLVKSFLEFAGTKGSRTYRKFKDRDWIYLSFILRKGTGDSGLE